MEDVLLKSHRVSYCQQCIVLVSLAAVMFFYGSGARAGDFDLENFYHGSIVGSGNYKNYFEKEVGTVKVKELTSQSNGTITIRQYIEISDGSIEDFTWTLRRKSRDSYVVNRSDLGDVGVLERKLDAFVISYRAPLQSNSGPSCPDLLSRVDESWVVSSAKSLSKQVKIYCANILMGESYIQISR